MSFDGNNSSHPQEFNIYGDNIELQMAECSNLVVDGINLPCIETGNN